VFNDTYVLNRYQFSVTQKGTTGLGSATETLKLSTHWPHVLALLTGRRFLDEESLVSDPGLKD